MCAATWQCPDAVWIVIGTYRTPRRRPAPRCSQPHGALRLYCDLLSMPGVLKPEHSHYAEELRLLSKRNEELIEHLIQLLSQERADVRPRTPPQRRLILIPLMG